MAEGREKKRDRRRGDNPFQESSRITERLEKSICDGVNRSYAKNELKIGKSIKLRDQGGKKHAIPGHALHWGGIEKRRCI